MNLRLFGLLSLKARLTLLSLLIFVGSIWALSLYISALLQDDMQRLLGQEQFSTVSVVAATVNQEMEDRLVAVKTVASDISAALMANPVALQNALQQRPIFYGLFNGGVNVLDRHGNAIATAPADPSRMGVNYMDRDYVAAALSVGKTSISQPVMGKVLQAPIFIVTTPVRDAQGKIIGALLGVTNLGKPNFLDKITRAPYGKSGGYLIVAAEHRQVITATDKKRVMEALPARGASPFVDRNIAGYEGFSVVINSLGVEQLASVKQVPSAGWYVVLGTPTAEALEPVRNLRQRIRNSTILLSILVAALTWWMLRRQLSPLMATSRALVTLSKESHIPPPLPVTGKDEIGQLAAGFNRLVESWTRREDLLTHSEQQYRSLLENLASGVVVHGADTSIVLSNPAACALLGLTHDQMMGKTAIDPAWAFLQEDGTPLTLANYPVNQVISSGKALRNYVAGIRHPTRSEPSWVLCNAYPMRGADGSIAQVVVTFTDITDRKVHEHQLEHVAHFDALTNLANRVLLADRLQNAMAQALRRHKQLAVVYLDLDGFKAINDRHNHAAGDHVLVTLAQRMKQSLREGDSMARLGGDEFVAVLIDLEDQAACRPLLARLMLACSEPVQIGELKLEVSASLGVTFYPQSQEVDADQLLRQADQAMYQAKVAGKNRYCFFDEQHESSEISRNESVERIRRALQQQELVLHYQPKVNMRTGQVVGAEALIRWQHPDKGLLAPREFLPVIENHALAIDIGEWVLDTALTQLASWDKAGLSIGLSVNVGAQQLQDSAFVPRLQALLVKHPQVRPTNLELEVLESGAMGDIALVSRVIDACTEIGVKFALDDFGTGYSPLTYLKRLRVATLKIDRSFVQDMLEDADDLAILQGVISLAAAFNLKVVAEGVEEVGQGSLLLQLGCELAQGYVIARPMPASELLNWAAAWKPDAKWLQI